MEGMKLELLQSVIDIFVHLDEKLGVVIQAYGIWTYLILFLILFAETGLVVTPFLPGDSLLFVAGAFAAGGSLDLMTLFVLLSVAAILGDTVNYQIGHFFGPKVFDRDMRFLNRENLEKTQRFYEKHGGKTIIIARFMPIIRTFAPFVAGVGSMTYRRFLAYNVVGGLLWVTSILFCGYFFGNLPVVKENFELVIFAIIGISIAPAVFGYLKERYQLKRSID